MAPEENGQKTKYLESRVTFTGREIGVGEISFGSYPSLLDVPLLDP